MNPVIQQAWSVFPIRKRLKIFSRARHQLAAMSAALTDAIPRPAADTLAAELLPLLDAIRFLERNAERILQPQYLGSAGRPFWLGGVSSEIYRNAFGHILVIGPANFPLFLPGVQVAQALAAGNSVTWKPGSGGRAVADLFAGAFKAAGLPAGLLKITDDTIDAAYTALSQAPAKVIFTGSADSGKDILTKLAESTTPAVMELSGADAVIVLPSANLETVVKAITFGLRLNGGAVCMSPRRLLALGDTITALRPLLERELAAVPPVALSRKTQTALRPLIDQALSTGARLIGEYLPNAQRPLVVDSALPTMAITTLDTPAPILSLITVSTIPKFPDVYAECPYALTVAIFGDEAEARTMGAQLRAGTLLINDLIVPTADPRIPFGGRAGSGFGATRGAEGLLEMTAAKTILVRRGSSTRHLDPTGPNHAAMFEGAIQASHASGLGTRLSGLRKMISAATKIGK